MFLKVWTDGDFLISDGNLLQMNYIVVDCIHFKVCRLYMSAELHEIVVLIDSRGTYSFAMHATVHHPALHTYLLQVSALAASHLPSVEERSPWQLSQQPVLSHRPSQTSS